MERVRDRLVTKVYCMKTRFFISILFIGLYACNREGGVKNKKTPYVPISQEIYDTIIYWERIYSEAFKKCDLVTIDLLTYENIEYYHDQGGLMISKEYLLKSLVHMCGRNREIDEGSEVYPVKNFGAIHVGKQRFFDDPPEKNKSTFRRFVHVWRHQGDRWKLTRMVTISR